MRDGAIKINYNVEVGNGCQLMFKSFILIGNFILFFSDLFSESFFFLHEETHWISNWKIAAEQDFLHNKTFLLEENF